MSSMLKSATKNIKANSSTSDFAAKDIEDDPSSCISGSSTGDNEDDFSILGFAAENVEDNPFILGSAIRKGKNNLLVWILLLKMSKTVFLP